MDLGFTVWGFLFVGVEIKKIRKKLENLVTLCFYNSEYGIAACGELVHISRGGCLCDGK